MDFEIFKKKTAYSEDPDESALEKARFALDLAEAESEVLFKQYRTAFYRRFSGEVETDQEIDAAREDMEAAVIKAGNAYLKVESWERKPEAE